MIDIGFSRCRHCHILVGKYSVTWRFFRGHFVMGSFKISCASRRHQSIPEDVLALWSVSSSNSRALPIFRVTQSRSLRQFRGLIVDRCVIPFGSLGCNSLRSGGAVQARICKNLGKHTKFTIWSMLTSCWCCHWQMTCRLWTGPFWMSTVDPSCLPSDWFHLHSSSKLAIYFQRCIGPLITEN